MKFVASDSPLVDQYARAYALFTCDTAMCSIMNTVPAGFNAASLQLNIFELVCSVPGIPAKGWGADILERAARCEVVSVSGSVHRPISPRKQVHNHRVESISKAGSPHYKSRSFAPG